MEEGEDHEEPLKEIREKTKERLDEFLDAKRAMDNYLRTLKKEQKEELKRWQRSHENTTPVYAPTAIQFVEAACKLKPYLLFWEFLRFRYLGSQLTLAPDFIRESLQLHALINAYTLSFQFVARGTDKNRFYFAQPVDKLYGEFGVFPSTVKNLQETIKMDFPVEKSGEVIILISGKDGAREASNLLDHDGEPEEIEINGEPRGVKVHHTGSDIGRRLSDAYGITEYPATIYNGMAIQGASEENLAKTIGEDAEDSIAEEVDPYIKHLKELDLLEALKKSIRKKTGYYTLKRRKLKKKGLNEREIEEKIENWRMPFEKWMEPFFSGKEEEQPEEVSPDYYLVKAACRAREVLSLLKRAISGKYRNFFRTQPEMFVSLHVLSQATHDITEKDINKRLEWDEKATRFNIRSSKMWEAFMLFVTSLWEVKGFQLLVDLKVTDLTAPRDRVVFIDEKNCAVCSKFYGRKKLKDWREKGKWRGMRADFYDNAESTMGVVWLRRLYLVTSPEEVEWFGGMEMKRQKVKTRDTPLIMWGSRLYGNTDGEGFGEDTTIMEILNKLLQEHKDDLLKSYKRQLRGLRTYRQRRLGERYPSRERLTRPSASTSGASRSSGEAGQAGERRQEKGTKQPAPSPRISSEGSLPQPATETPEYLKPKDNEGRRHYAWRLYTQYPELNFTQQEIANWVARHHPECKSTPDQSTISNWVSRVEKRMNR